MNLPLSIQRNFTFIKEIPRSRQSTTFNMGVYTLNDDTMELAPEKWFIKSNKLSWVIREYLAGGLYQYFLDVPEVKLVIDEGKPTYEIHRNAIENKPFYYHMAYKQGYLPKEEMFIQFGKLSHFDEALAKAKKESKKNPMPKNFLFEEEKTFEVKLATKYIEELNAFEIAGQGFYKSYEAQGIPFKCLRGGCNIIENDIRESSYYERSIYQGKEIIGYELAKAVSIFLDDPDIMAGNNFALLHNQNNITVTRLDYDSSFYFLDLDRVSKQPFSISPDFTQYPVIFYNNAYKKASFEKWFDNLNFEREGKEFGYKLTLDAFKKIAEANKGEIQAIIHQKMEDIERAVGEDKLEEVFDKSRLEKLVGHKDASIVQLLEDHIINRLFSRIKDFNNMLSCLIIETSYKSGSYWAELFNTNININQARCDSFYGNNKNNSLEDLSYDYGYGPWLATKLAGLLHSSADHDEL